MRVEWPKKSSAWITQVYYGWGTAMAYVENQVAECGAQYVEGGTPIASKLKSFKLELSASQTDPVTMTARKSGYDDYAASVTIPAGSTDATWTGDVTGVTNLIWRLSTTPGVLIAAEFTATMWVEPA